MKHLLVLLFAVFLVDTTLAESLSTRSEMVESVNRAEEQIRTQRERYLDESLNALERTTKAMTAAKKAFHNNPSLDAAGTLPSGRQGTSLETLIEQYESVRHRSSPNGSSSLLLFVSFSMPADVLREYSRQARQADATLVLRGNYLGQTVRKTTLMAHEVNSGHVSWVINPNLYTGYKIDAVPALVLSSDGHDTNEDGCYPDTSYAVVVGELSIIGSLEKIALGASDPLLRKLAEDRIAALNRR